MLTTPDYFQVLHLPGDGFNDLFCHLPRNQDKANGPVVSWVLPLAFLEERSDICFFFFFALCSGTSDLIPYVFILKGSVLALVPT